MFGFARPPQRPSIMIRRALRTERGMTPHERQARAEWLATLGVPGSFRHAIIDAPNNLWTARGGTVLGLLMVAVTIGAMMATFLWLQGHVQARAAALAAQSGATLTHVNVGMGPLILLFGLLALMGSIGSALAAHLRVNGFLSSAAAMLNSPPTQGIKRRITQWILSGSVRWAGSRSTSVDDFLRAMAGHQARKWGIAALVLLLPAVVVTALETNSFWVVGPTGVVEHRMFPPFSSRRYDFSEAKMLTTGCNHTDKNNRLIYRLHLSSGEHFDLGDADPFRGNKIGAVEDIDAKVDPKIAHRRWSHLDRDPVHPACLTAWARQFDRDGQRRLAKLLRLTPDEVRDWSFR